MALVFYVPTASDFAIMVFVLVFFPFFLTLAGFAVFVLLMTFTFSVSISLSIGKCASAGKGKEPQGTGENPF
jgi:hypothetical protein